MIVFIFNSVKMCDYTIMYLLFSALCNAVSASGGPGEDGLPGQPHYQHPQPGGLQVRLPGASDDDLAMDWDMILNGNRFNLAFYFLLFTIFFRRISFISLFYYVSIVSSKPIPAFDDDLPADSDYDVMYWMTTFGIILFFVTIIVAMVARSFINNDPDDDFCDVGVSNNSKENSEGNDNHLSGKSSRSNGNGKKVRGVDRHWKVMKTFDNSEDYLASDIYQKIKKEFVRMRNRQFQHALVEEFR